MTGASFGHHGYVNAGEWMDAEAVLARNRFCVFVSGPEGRGTPHKSDLVRQWICSSD
jgi:hypothetical protein